MKAAKNLLFCFLLSVASVGVCDFRSGAQTITRFDHFFESAHSDSSALDSLHQLIWNLRNDSPTEALAFASKVDTLCRQLSNSRALARNINLQGLLYRNLSRYDEALTRFLRAAELRKEIKDSLGYGKSLMNIGMFYLRQLKEPEQANVYLLEALYVFKLKQNEEEIGNAYSNLTLIEFDQGNHAQAISYLDSSLVYKPDTTDAITWGTYNMNLGSTYLNASFGIDDSALCRELLLRSEILLKRSARVRKASGQQKYLASTYFNLAILNGELREMMRAHRFFALADSLAQVVGNDRLQTTIAYEQAYTYQLSGEFEAASNAYVKHIKLLKVLNDQQNTQQLAEVRTKYETEKTAQENALLRQDAQLQQATNTNLQLTLWGLLALLVAIVALVVYIRQRMGHKLKQKEYRILQLSKDVEVKNMAAMMDGQEQERKRIAQELHDNIGGMLSGIQMRVGSLEKKTTSIQTEQATQFTHLNTLLQECMGEVRRISHNLVSSVLMKFGLVAAIKELADTISATSHIKVAVRVFGVEPGIENRIAVGLYRIIQEFVNNSIKHANCTEIIIRLRQQENRLHLTYRDNGSGFDTAKLRQKNGIGLSNVQDRVKVLNGTFEMDSKPGSHTAFNISVPLWDEPNDTSNTTAP